MSTPNHLEWIQASLTDDKKDDKSKATDDNSEELAINFLMKQALDKVFHAFRV